MERGRNTRFQKSPGEGIPERPDGNEYPSICYVVDIIRERVRYIHT